MSKRQKGELKKRIFDKALDRDEIGRKEVVSQILDEANADFPDEKDIQFFDYSDPDNPQFDPFHYLSAIDDWRKKWFEKTKKNSKVLKDSQASEST